MGDAPALTGPDFTQGVELSDIPEGGMLLGNANGEAVLVSKMDLAKIQFQKDANPEGLKAAATAIAHQTERCAPRRRKSLTSARARACRTRSREGTQNVASAHRPI